MLLALVVYLHVSIILMVRFFLNSNGCLSVTLDIGCYPIALNDDKHMYTVIISYSRKRMKLFTTLCALFVISLASFRCTNSSEVSPSASFTKNNDSYHIISIKASDVVNPQTPEHVVLATFIKSKLDEPFSVPNKDGRLSETKQFLEKSEQVKRLFVVIYKNGTPITFGGLQNMALSCQRNIDSSFLKLEEPLQSDKLSFEHGYHLGGIYSDLDQQGLLEAIGKDILTKLLSDILPLTNTRQPYIIMSEFIENDRMIHVQEKVFLGKRIGDEKGLHSQEHQRLRLHFLHKL